MSRNASIYNLVYDEEQIKRFAKLIKTEDNIHVLFLSCRPKYNHDFKQEMICSQSFFNRTSEEFVELVRRYEVEKDSYKQNGKPIPTNALVLYCTTNPRNGKKAGRKLLAELIDAGFDQTDTFNHLQSRLTSSLMSSKGVTNLLTIDIDDKKEYPEVEEFFQNENILVEATIETRGGYHVLFRPTEKTEKVFKTFSSKHTIGDISCAVPGTYQGGFPVRFVN